ncbi:RNA-directed DNA polymerase [Salmonella enterica]|uniref:RNA-directed DNA polymerase n=1 Tax=Salmonella enterica subsp. diarizonae serovar 48:i:z TaxID=1192842 RepID=A0A7U5YFK4_SALDZ|nr:reverse transcriptase family protein [Salmonella enterica]EAA4453240.1 RNA-directed DNA polymerase [Salmonella enterica subsp. diarizonae]EDW6120224.1 RNA-directed DNA polymerase [Salmonella enterica subsp. salamae]AXC72036.1 RNA-directed DNA polymerase [Salmonella enterica subsp. diarizonae serovar 48:i:z]EAM6407824.1 RNA-directed DNA polymerase [Salmonella enterica]EAN2415325.1 RNA-directed DNA polymerase [Salmonella enterica]
MYKNWNYSNRPLANLESLFKILETNEERLTYLLKNKKNFFKTVPVIRKGKKRTTYKVVGELLKIHELIKQRIFSKISLPEYITGGRKGVSYIDDCISHRNKSIIIQEDMKDFFPSIKEELIAKAFQYYMNFSPEVSSLLANLSTLEGSLVQGTKLSTDIANLIFLEEEALISEEVRKLGGNYTRYVDDITISFESGVNNEGISKIKTMILSMVLKSGIRLNRKKSKVLRNGQSKIVHGVKVIKELRPTQKRKDNIRMCLFNLKKKVIEKESVMDVLTMYFKIRGLINTLKQQGDKNHAEYIKQANQIIAGVDKKDAIKSIRQMRKVRDIKRLRFLYSKLKPLGNSSKSVSAILDVEYENCKSKLNK